MNVEQQLVRKTMTNSDVNTRIWNALQRLDDRAAEDGTIVAPVGSTLELDPGESADVMVQLDFVDPWLKEAKVMAPKRGGSKKEPEIQEMQKEG
jgi:hypothetical protein